MVLLQPSQTIEFRGIRPASGILDDEIRAQGWPCSGGVEDAAT